MRIITKRTFVVYTGGFQSDIDNFTIQWLYNRFGGGKLYDNGKLDFIKQRGRIVSSIWCYLPTCFPLKIKRGFSYDLIDRWMNKGRVWHHKNVIFLADTQKDCQYLKKYCKIKGFVSSMLRDEYFELLF